ncbi:DUF6686 family protein [Maribellus maritimus]|uniref:DUF6686 family protein n=1 Tax=Maribellus maritimus TaxID=2870838 RepID=UPI001EEA58CF|nr:DUF6686 family protein [Maribellus maritimus]MCG6190272.1 hypothetical protein [Maribellus maritimus]
MKLINKTLNGQITFCPESDVFHLEFGNVLLTLTLDELRSFKEYVYSIDPHYYLHHNRNAFNNRKLLLKVDNSRIMFCVYKSEFFELKLLLSMQKETWMLNPGKVYFNNILIFN